MDILQLIKNLGEVFEKNAQEEKNLAKENQRSRITSVLERHYGKGSDKIKKANKVITDMFSAIARKSISKSEKTSPEDYKNSVYRAYFSNEMLKVLNREENESYKSIYVTLFNSLRRQFETNINGVPGVITSSLNSLGSKVQSPEQSTVLPAVICYLLKLQNRIKKYNNMVEKANADKEAKRNTGIRKAVKFEEREREKSPYLKNDDDDDDLTSSTKSQESSEDSLEEEGWEFVEGDSESIKKSIEVLKDVDNVKNLNGFAAQLRKLADIATDLSGSKNFFQWFGRMAKDLSGIDQANLTTISKNLNEIAGTIEKEKPTPDDVKNISSKSNETLGLVNSYEKNKLPDKQKQQKRPDERSKFLEAAKKCLKKLNEVEKIYEQTTEKIDPKTKEQISAEIAAVEDIGNEEYDSYEEVQCADSLEALANIALEIRSATQQAGSNSNSLIVTCLNYVLIGLKNVAQEAENMAGYDLASLTGISTSLQGIASNIRAHSYKSFMEDVEGVKGLLDGYESKIAGRNDELKDVRDEFIKKTKSCLDAIEKALNDRTPEAELKSIVDDFSAKIDKIDVKSDQTPDVYSEQLKELANIAPEIRNATQNLAGNSDTRKSATNSAMVVLNFLKLIKKDNLLGISTELGEIAEKVPYCESEEITKVKKSIQSYQLKKSGIKDGLAKIRKKFTKKAFDCLEKVEKLIEPFKELKEKFKNKKGGEPLSKASSDYIKALIKNNIDSIDNTMALNFSGEIISKLNANDGDLTLSDNFLKNIVPSPGAVKTFATDFVKSFTSALGEKGGIAGAAAGKFVDVTAGHFLKDECTAFDTAIKKFFENMNSEGNPIEKYTETLENISKYSQKQFKNEIQNTRGIGSSYVTYLEKLRTALSKFMIDFYGCAISKNQKVTVPSVGGNFNKWINVFSYPNLFSNAVSLCNNFNSCIIKPLKEYPDECLSEQRESEELKEAKKTQDELKKDWEVRKKCFDLYNQIISRKEKLGINEEDYKSRIDEKESEKEIKEIIFSETNGEIPDSEEKFSDAVSHFMDVDMENIEKELGESSGIFSSIWSSLFGSSISDSKILKHKSLCILETMIENKGLNNFNESEYESFKKSYKNFTENYGYLENFGLS